MLTWFYNDNHGLRIGNFHTRSATNELSPSLQCLTSASLS